MPKSLSLKKVRSGPPKNQKSITQFFKNSESTTQKAECNLPDSQQDVRNKRKATASDSSEYNSKFQCSNVYSGSTNGHTKKAKKETNIILNVCTNKKGVLQGSLNTVECKNILDESQFNQDSFGIDQNKLYEKNIILSEGSEDKSFSNNVKERSPLSIVVNVEHDICIQSLHEDGDLFTLSPSEPEGKSCKTKSPNGKENAVKNQSIELKTPPKLHNSDLKNSKNESPSKNKKSPNKSPIETIELRRSPRIAKLKLSTNKEVHNHNKKSPEKVKKALDFGCDDMNGMFDDELWSNENYEIEQNDLDLSKMHRCEIINLNRYPTRIELTLKNSCNKKTTCYVEGIWKDIPLSIGDIVSVLATKSSENVFCVNNSTGLLVHRPDFLMSSTSIVSGVFCRRKAVLQERFKGLDSSNVAMTIGILVHELVQRALTQKIHAVDKLRSEADSLIKESIHMLYGAGVSMDEVYASMNMYIPPLSDFIKQYVLGEPCSGMDLKGKWNGLIDNVVDIEENICCSQLGLKGKIDATLQVTIHNKKEKKRVLMPLELKSGKASGSVEHRGQLVLYGMMLALQRDANPANDPDQSGLLLYLRDKIDLREVRCGYPERRDLIMLRNQLVQYLAPGPQKIDYDNIADIEEASHLMRQKLPEPVHHQTACEKCPYLTICSLHLWHTDGPRVPDTHPLYKLRNKALGHLSDDHSSYFLRWVALCKLEERSQTTCAPLHALWTESPEKRAQRGICIQNLLVKSVEVNGDRFMHVFQREKTLQDTSKDNTKRPQEGDFAIVSTTDRPWIAAGTVSVVNTEEIHMLLERDLSRRHLNTTLFHVDTYESYASAVQNLTNLGALIEDDDNSNRLRKFIIDKETPEFEKKLPREVGRLGSKMMKGLNIEQQRAVFRAIAAKDYALLQGLPGTGKTQTISVLIQLLVALKKRVLVTAHTHSAVDNVLMRLPKTLKILRLGSSTRVASELQSCCDYRLAEACATPEELSKLYDSMEVVGVTCLGASHSLLTKAKFDICIVDEATQVLQCTVLRPLFAARKFVLVGDPAQLPPVVRSNAARRLGMEESLFARLTMVGTEAQSTLCLQYRMNGAITELANSVAYENRLKCASDDVRDARMRIHFEKLTSIINSPWLLATCSPASEHSVVFLDTGPTNSQITESKSNANKDEVLIVLAILKAMTMGGVPFTDIGIISPYREQVALLRTRILRLNENKTPDVSTIDQFQGRDKSVIIFSCTKNSDDIQERKAKEGEILDDPRRLAVSVTRAKHKFIMIGYVNTLQRYKPFKKLIEVCTPFVLPTDWQHSLYEDFGHLL